ncbi:MAG: aldose epimerase [Elainellaceae cyanobacterium]
MFEVSQHPSQYLTYALTDSATDARLEVVPERGGIITRWSVQGRDILYLDEARFADPSLSVRGGIPILFPICGNLPNNAYTYNGQTYRLKQHGFARDLPWQVIHTEALERASITLNLSSSDYTRALYPFEFSLDFTYILEGNRLVLQQQVTNSGNTIMPFSLGLHPYFAVSDKARLDFDIPSTQYVDQRTQEIHAYMDGFDFSLDEIDVLFRKLAFQSATVEDFRENLKLRLDFDDPYTMLVFWTLKGKDFYCLEPWTGPRNALNTGDHLIELAPGGTARTSVRLTAQLS